VIGKTISHYKIIEKLGEGGMGVVYKAEDTKLKRFVALKFLPPELTRDTEARERFVQEAQTASALDHANINTIYEIGQTDDGQMFISMACYEGETLREKLKRGYLRPREAIDLAKQIARGLARAHESNIVHRDIKPANIMVTNRDEARILDFGLAKLAGQVGITKTGTTVGTAAYMSPEQARGEEVDHRTDIWSLGVVLYEMFAGKRPFAGGHEQAVVYSIINEDPKPLTQLRPELPWELQQIIDKALAKSPDERYQSAGELAGDLDHAKEYVGDSGGLSFQTSRKTGAKRARRLRMLPAAAIIVLVLAGFVYVTQFRHSPDQGATTIETSAEKVVATAEFDRSIVVLPFEDISPTGDNEYFSDGLTDEIIADLSRVRSLRVISRTSAMALKGTDMDIKSIGERLDVRYVLEGSVRKAGDKLKITAQLIDATIDAHVWTEKYDGTLDDVFDIQEQVSRSIVDALEVELNPDEDQEIAERPLDDVRAYELYLRARLEIGHMSEESIDNALEDLERGLEIVGENELIYAAVGYAYYQYVNIGASILGEYEGKIEECAEKIFELEPESVHGYMLLARLEIMRGNTRREVEYLKKVLERDPQNSDALSWLAFAYAAHAKMDAAWRIFRTIERNDPLRPRLRVTEAFLNWVDGRFGMALEIVEKMYDSGIPRTLEKMFYATMLIYNRRPDDASRVTADLEKDAPGDYLTLLTRFLINAYEGRKADVERTMTSDFVAATEQDFQYSMMTAGGYSLLGEKEKALYWLENAIKRGFNNYVHMSEHDPFLATLRGEERFKELMRVAKARCDEFEVLE
jgi:non-specific serine/threonine protein kinase